MASPVAALATTTELSFDGFASGWKGVVINYEGAGGSLQESVAAGGFTMTGTNPVGSFIAWCVDIFSPLSKTAETYAYQSFLGTAQLSRVQKVFDANFAGASDPGGALSSAINSAAFQVALWDAAFDDDWDAGAYGGGSTGFRISKYAGSSLAVHNGVLAQANAYLAAAESYAGLTLWSLTQYDSADAQSLVSAQAFSSLAAPLPSPVPLPLGGAMIAVAFGGVGAMSALRRRRKA